MSATDTSAAGNSSACGRLRRVRARGRQRGALFIEGLAVVLTIGVLLAILSWFHSVYRTKGDTLAAARLEAWQRARPGCRLAAAETLLARAGERTSLAPGGGLSGDLALQTRAIVTCNEPPAGDEPSVASALDSLQALVPWRPVAMERWFSGSVSPLSGLLGTMEFLGRSVSSAADDVSRARDALADQLGDVLAWVEQAAADAFEWMNLD